MGRLHRLQHWLFHSDDSLLARPLQIDTLRGEEPMQVVSGRLSRPTVHLKPHPRRGLEAQLNDY